MESIPWSFYAILSFVLFATVMLKQTGIAEFNTQAFTNIIEKQNAYSKVAEASILEPSSGIYKCDGLFTDKPKNKTNCKPVKLKEQA